MGFVARINSPNRQPPVRAYVHEAGLIDAYSSGGRSLIQNAQNHLLETLDSQDLSRYQFLLAAVWGRRGDRPADAEKMIDFFGLSDIRDWPGNPDVSAWVLKNGVYSPQKEITCGDTLIVLGREEAYRRICRDMEEFETSWPDLGSLEPRETIKL